MDWLHFTAVILAQGVILVVFAESMGTIDEFAPRSARLYIFGLLGFIFGVPLDIAVGLYGGMFGYVLGFSTMFLAINGVLAYGLWIAVIYAIRAQSWWKFYLSSVLIGAGYELINWFYPVWAWHFLDNDVLEEVLVIGLGYFALAVCSAVFLRLVLGTQFRIFQR